MKTKNQLWILFAIALLLNSTTSFAQGDEQERPEYISVTTMHWNMDYEDWDMDTWKAVEKEYLDKITMKNEHLMGASIFLHKLTPDNSELLYVQVYKDWNAIDKASKRNDELEDEAWPDEDARKAYFKKRGAYYAPEHSDEIYATMSGAKLVGEKSDDMILYIRKSHFDFPEDGSFKEYKELRDEHLEKVVHKNEYIKGYYPSSHAYGSDRTEFIEAFYLDSMADLDKMFKRSGDLAKEAWPDAEARKARGKKVGKYFTGIHGDYVYGVIPELSK
jgi:hypothetical protein